MGERPLYCTVDYECFVSLHFGMLRDQICNKGSQVHVVSRRECARCDKGLKIPLVLPIIVGGGAGKGHVVGGLKHAHVGRSSVKDSVKK